MPLGYGTKTELPKLTSNDIAKFKIEEKQSGGGGSHWLNWLLIALDVALSFIPGIDAISQAAIGLAFATSQTIIDEVETGEVTPTSLLLNFGSALIPGGVGVIKQGNRFINVGSKMVKEGEGLIESGIDSVKMGELGHGAITHGSFMQEAGASASFWKNPLTTYKKEATSWFEQVGKTNYDAMLKSDIGYLDSAKTAGLGFKEKSGKNDEEKLEKYLMRLTGLWKKEIKTLKQAVKDGQVRNYARWYGILRESFKRTNNQYLGKILDGAKKGKFIKQLMRKETRLTQISRLTSQTMSKTTKYGGMLLSPSSLASEIISKTVAKITPKVEELGERFAKKIYAFSKKGAKGLKELEDEFVQTGGIKVNSSWIMGIKLLNEDPIQSVVLFQFRPETTYHKKAVIANMSAIQMEEFLGSSSKGRWYLDHIARSRGGRKASSFSIEGELAAFMGVLPISKIQELLGFTSFGLNGIKQIRATGVPIFSFNNYATGLKSAIIEGVAMEGIKGAVALGTRNQYFKQALEGGLGGVIHGADYKSAFTSGFQGALSSYKDMRFEDHTASGNSVKELKKFQATGGSVKTIF